MLPPHWSLETLPWCWPTETVFARLVAPVPMLLLSQIILANFPRTSRSALCWCHRSKCSELCQASGARARWIECRLPGPHTAHLQCMPQVQGSGSPLSEWYPASACCPTSAAVPASPGTHCCKQYSLQVAELTLCQMWVCPKQQLRCQFCTKAFLHFQHHSAQMQPLRLMQSPVV